MAAFVGPIRSNAARNVTTGMMVEIRIIPEMASQPELLTGKWAPFERANSP